MSESSLLNLIELLAIIAKFRTDQTRILDTLNFFLANQLEIQDTRQYSDEFVERWLKRRAKNTSNYVVSELTQAIKICDELNGELTQGQKISVFILIFTTVENERSISEIELSFIQTISKLLNITEEDFFLCVSFNLISLSHDANSQGKLIAFSDQESTLTRDKSLDLPGLEGSISLLRLDSTNSYFIKHVGQETVTLNDSPMRDHAIYDFSIGDVLKFGEGAVMHFSDIISEITSSRARILMEVDEVSYSFPDGRIGIHEISFSETSGKLVGLMGASGAGKSTIMELLNGNLEPEIGKVLINCIDIHAEREKIEGVIGYVPQDDLLIEDLTVFQNLYFAAKLAFAGKTEEELTELVREVIVDLDLDKIAHFKVGNPLKKIISGGQRKRVNIGLELLRAPSVMFLDEPTSGLSSRDSQNIMNLLKRLSAAGKLIFVVIHQPSPEIFKLFDRLLIMDRGGYPIYYGNPLDAITYFKRKANQLNKETIYDQGRLNPEIIFDLIEAKTVTEFGSYTAVRKTSPEKWYEEFRKRPTPRCKQVEVPELEAIKPANWLRQLKTFITRDSLAKLNNLQYMLINVLQAPFLAIFLSFLNRYYDTSVSGNQYMFSDNQNMPVFLFVSIIVALFMGLTISAEEIVQDQKILKREQFLNLSRSSYLVSKIIILFTMSAFQTLAFWLVSSCILEIPKFSGCHIAILFSSAAFANLLGLNISAMFNKAITVYILIPILLIPQLVLGGIMLKFDKMNPAFKSDTSVPIASEFMVSRWAYEGVMVSFFVDNRYNQPLFKTKVQKHQADHHALYEVPVLESKIDRALQYINSDQDSMVNKIERDLLIVRNELRASKADRCKNPDLIKIGCEESVLNDALYQTNVIRLYWNDEAARASAVEATIIKRMQKELGGPEAVNRLRQQNHNDAIEKTVRALDDDHRVIERNDRLVVLADPIYRDPTGNRIFSITQFFSPYKYLFGFKLKTPIFNLIVMWLITVQLYIFLYYDWFKLLRNWFDRKIYGELFATFFDKNEKL
jgi:ABC-type multidrug transport system ATPase subunit